MPTFIKDLFDLPDVVRGGDFVLRLAEGLERPEQTLRDYVVTPQLAKCFDDALSLVRDALEGRSSKACYLLGSFGSGKSHFMAVLNLLLQQNATAREIAELAAAVTKHNPWTSGKKFMLVPFNLIGATGLEAALLGGYADHIRRHYPDAPTPPVYRAEALFEDAKGLREAMGDKAFFAKLNREENGGAAAAPAVAGWGELEGGWDAKRFDRALIAVANNADRRQLVTDLVETFFSAAQNNSEFISLDDGLSVMSHHARELGFDAVILFLDELILWLASHAADPSFVAREGQKLVKLVEASRADRPIPLVSFIAKQREIADLVRDQVTGAQLAAISDVLRFWEARFASIRLQDSNLPAIAEKRLLKPKSEAAKAEIDAAFAQTMAVQKNIRDILLTDEGNPEMFRRLYPFSPALIETLVVMSFALQRERTALRVMLQILVEQKSRLKLGDIVPAGDIFDVISEGTDAVSDVVKRDFEKAKRLYEQKLRPVLEQQHGMRTEQAFALPPEDPTGLAFRADDRIIKTLLLAALAPTVKTLKDMDAQRLVALNHGSYRTPIPGREQTVVIDKCRRWAAATGVIKLEGSSDNPRITLQLTDVDTDRIIEQAQAEDNDGNRRRKIRELLFEEFGLPKEEAQQLFYRYKFRWRGTDRECELQYANVREQAFDTFKNKAEQWRVIIDFPFDQPPHGPRSDLSRLQQFRNENEEGFRTLVWIPSFLNHDALKELGRLVILDHILTGERFDQYVSHLSPADKASAKGLLETQQKQLRAKMVAHLQAVYSAGSGLVNSADAAHQLEPSEQFQCLDETGDIQPPVAANFKQALTSLLSQALQKQFPAHPMFDDDANLRPAALGRVLEEVTRAIQTPDGRIIVDQSKRRELRQVANPLKLGDMTTESAFVLGHHWKNHFDRKEAEHGGPVTVAKLREWMDEPQRWGLQRDLQNLVLIFFATHAQMNFHLHGRLIEPEITDLPEEAELRTQRLPSQNDWEEAGKRAASIFGVVAPPLLNAVNTAKLATDIKAVAQQYKTPADQLVPLVANLCQRVDANTASARIKTARATKALIDSLATAEGVPVIEGLARAAVETSASAMGTSLKSCQALGEKLRQTNWQLLEAVRQLTDHRKTEAEAIWAALKDAAQKDEYVMPLESSLRTAESRAIALLAAVTVPPVAPPVTPPVVPVVPPPVTPGKPGLPAILFKPNVVASHLAVLNSDEAEIRAFYGSDTERLQRNRRLVEELKKLYGESQVEGDSLPDGLPAERILEALEVHHIKALGEGGPDEKKNMIVLSATLHALIHADPGCRIDLANGTMTLFGVQLKVRVKSPHL
ncbi:MAG: phage resistance protein [Verrucomicrobiota bacterium]